MRKVVLESPFAGNVETNIKYARRAMKHALDLGEAPYASHLLFTQEGILDDNIQEERNKGIEAGLIWGSCAEATVVYVDYGISKGMQLGIERAQAEGRSVFMRTIGKNE